MPHIAWHRHPLTFCGRFGKENKENNDKPWVSKFLSGHNLSNNEASLTFFTFNLLMLELTYF